jgi:hypothetical protein
MSVDADTLYRLLPAIHRLRDAEQAPPGQLRALLQILAAEFSVMDDNIDQLLDDLFIETSAEWVIPYIGDLIGYEPLHSLGRAQSLARAEVAHTIALRRRKGTAAVLEQLARDVTGWNARAVECFQLLGATQYMNHTRPHSRYAPNLRYWEPLSRIGGAFDSLSHTVDVRRVDNGSGRFNIPHIALFLWRLTAYPHTHSPAVQVDDRRYLISPLGHALPLFTHPQTEDQITHLAEPIHVPDPIRRRAMHDRLAQYCSSRPTASAPVDLIEPSLSIHLDGVEVPRSQVVVCNLSDDGAGWAHAPLSGPLPDGTTLDDKIGVDPELGRIALGVSVPIPDGIDVSYHHGFSAAMGGGEYRREREDDAPGVTVVRVPTDQQTIADALAALSGDGVVEITDSRRYPETLAIQVAPGRRVVVRAAERCWPTLILAAELPITGGTDSTCSLEGLRIAGAALRVSGGASQLARLRIAHTTLVPGLALDAQGLPLAPDQASLSVESADVTVELDHAIVGALRVHGGSSVIAKDSIIDATASDRMACAAPDGLAPSGTLSLDACTLIGRVRALAVGTVSNSILLARRGAGDARPAVTVVRRQSGCVRFSHLPTDALTPRRYRCQPESAAPDVAPEPQFTSLRYGAPGFCQISRTTPDAIRRGADDESEMGAFHALFPAQRETNLRIRLNEFLRVGLAAGVFYET